MFCSASVLGCAMPSSLGRCLMMVSAVLFLISTMSSLFLEWQVVASLPLLLLHRLRWHRLVWLCRCRLVLLWLRLLWCANIHLLLWLSLLLWLGYVIQGDVVKRPAVVLPHLCVEARCHTVANSQGVQFFHPFTEGGYHQRVWVVLNRLLYNELTLLPRLSALACPVLRRHHRLHNSCYLHFLCPYFYF